MVGGGEKLQTGETQLALKPARSNPGVCFAVMPRRREMRIISKAEHQTPGSAQHPSFGRDRACPGARRQGSKPNLGLGQRRASSPLAGVGLKLGWCFKKRKQCPRSRNCDSCSRARSCLRCPALGLGSSHESHRAHVEGARRSRHPRRYLIKGGSGIGRLFCFFGFFFFPGESRGASSEEKKGKDAELAAPRLYLADK